MYCEKCGAQNADNSTFCEKCGNKLSTETISATPVTVTKPVNTKKALIIMGVIAAFIVVIVVLVLVITAPTKIVLDDYIYVNIEGYDGVGTARLDFDSDRMIADMSKDLSEAEATRFALALTLGQKLDLGLDRIGNLSNDEVVNLVLTYDEVFFDAYNLKIVLKNTKYEVKGLKESTVINPFDFLEVTYNGYSPYASLVLTNTSSDTYLKENITFSTNNSSYLEEGEKFSVIVHFNEYNASRNGYIISTTEKEYTATGLPQPKEIDLFEYLEFSISGVDGDGKLSYERKKGTDEDEFLSQVRFQADKTENLTAGDTVQFTVYYPDKTESYGYKVASDKMTITVPALSVYITDLNAVSDNIRTQIIDAMEDAIAEVLSTEELDRLYLTSGMAIWEKDHYYNMNDYTSFEQITPTHTYHCTVRDVYGLHYVYYNRVGIVYTVDLSGHPTEAANGTAYSYAYMDDAILTPDGTLEDGWEDKIMVCIAAANSYDVMYKKWFSGSDTLVIEEIK